MRHKAPQSVPKCSQFHFGAHVNRLGCSDWERHARHDRLALCCASFGVWSVFSASRERMCQAGQVIRHRMGIEHLVSLQNNANFKIKPPD